MKLKSNKITSTKVSFSLKLAHVPKNIKSENKIPGLHVAEKDPITDLSNIPTIEDISNKEKNQNRKDKNYNKKPTKAKPISLDVNLSII